MEGFFQLKSSQDLLKKLQYEFELLRKKPDDAYVAYNFFVTAEHMLDWIYPGRINRRTREMERENSVLLQLCSHIANGAKHFEVENPQHKSVSSTTKTSGYFPTGWIPNGYNPVGWFPESELVIYLDGSARDLLGEKTKALDLAVKLVFFWNNHHAFNERI